MSSEHGGIPSQGITRAEYDQRMKEAKRPLTDDYVRAEDQGVKPVGGAEDTAPPKGHDIEEGIVDAAQQGSRDDKPSQT